MLNMSQLETLMFAPTCVKDEITWRNVDGETMELTGISTELMRPESD